MEVIWEWDFVFPWDPVPPLKRDKCETFLEEKNKTLDTRVTSSTDSLSNFILSCDPILTNLKLS